MGHNRDNLFQCGTKYIMYFCLKKWYLHTYPLPGSCPGIDRYYYTVLKLKGEGCRSVVKVNLDTILSIGQLLHALYWL